MQIWRILVFGTRNISEGADYREYFGHLLHNCAILELRLTSSVRRPLVGDIGYPCRACVVLT